MGSFYQKVALIFQKEYWIKKASQIHILQQSCPTQNQLNFFG
jgi:hypothetical protein